MSKNKSALKKKLWSLTSEYIRRKFSDEFGMCKCATCETTKHWKEMQAGHFVPKAQGNAVYFVEENIHPQCYRCNINLGGNGPEYNAYMLEMYGQEKIDELRRLSNTTVKFSVSDYEEMIAEVKKRLEEL